MNHNDGQNARPVPRITIQAFCEDQQTSQTIHEASSDRRMSKVHVTVQMGGIQAATRVFTPMRPTPNLIIVESVQDREPMLAALDSMAEVCDEGTQVIVIGHVNDVLLYRQLVQRGVSEYLVAPLHPLQVIEGISNLYLDPEAEHVGRIISFIAAKGGVGSSTICHNTAYAVTRALDMDAVIADFDLPYGTGGTELQPGSDTGSCKRPEYTGTA